MDAKQKERWIRRILTLSVTVSVAVVVVWVLWNLKWIHRRHEFIREKVDSTGPIVFSDIGPDVPGWLWLFGEEAAEFIILKSTTDTVEAQRLFPEARVIDPSDWNVE